jgi:hypothetical protein
MRASGRKVWRLASLQFRYQHPYQRASSADRDSRRIGLVLGCRRADLNRRHRAYEARALTG